MDARHVRYRDPVADPVLVLDLYSEEPVLGPRRFVRQASVRFGRPMIYPVSSAELDPLLERRPDLANRQFLLLRLPFDLEPPRPNRRYEAATVEITFDDDAVVALDVMPTAPNDDESLHLDIRGIGRPTIAWDLRPGAPQAGLRPRSRVMQVVLDAPAESTEFRGALSATVTVARIKGAWPKSTAASQQPRRFVLGTDGTFTVEPDRPNENRRITGPIARRTGGRMAPVDVLIITALQEEYNAARSAQNGVGQWREQESDGHTPHLIGEYATPTGNRLTVALARPTRMGGRQTGPIATTLTDLLQPTFLAMCGVCGGNPDMTAPGDVIVAAPAYQYDEGKHVGDEFRGDHRQYPLNDRWLRAVQDFDPSHLPSYGVASQEEAEIWFLERLYMGQDPRSHPARPRYFPKGTWSDRLARLEAEGLIAWQDARWVLTGAGTAKIERILSDDVDGPDRLPFAVEPGPMASGSAVMEHPGIWTRLKEMGVRTILGLEMEAATIATVAHAREVPYWLVAKGVMDHANAHKNDRYKGFAARASAEVLFALLGRLLPGRPDAGNRGSRPEPSPPVIPGAVKLDVILRLHFDWQDLADLVGVPIHERARFAAGNEPRALWEWLEVRGRLAELPAALDEIGRGDLSERLRPYVLP